jgi:hypothetical protein
LYDLALVLAFCNWEKRVGRRSIASQNVIGIQGGGHYFQFQVVHFCLKLLYIYGCREGGGGGRGRKREREMM